MRWKLVKTIIKQKKSLHRKQKIMNKLAIICGKFNIHNSPASRIARK